MSKFVTVHVKRLRARLPAVKHYRYHSPLYTRQRSFPFTTETLEPANKDLRLYNAYCISIMLYNCNSWAAPKAMLDKLDACHRRHLRSITGHCWPKSIITNQALYKLCNEEPLSLKVAKQRWSMLGHILRMDPDTSSEGPGLCRQWLTSLPS